MCLLCAIVILVEALVIPHSLAFKYQPPYHYSMLATLLFSIEICVNFRTGIHYLGATIWKPSLIAYHYITTMSLLAVMLRVGSRKQHVRKAAPKMRLSDPFPTAFTATLVVVDR